MVPLDHRCVTVHRRLRGRPGHDDRCAELAPAFFPSVKACGALKLDALDTPDIRTIFVPPPPGSGPCRPPAFADGRPPSRHGTLLRRVDTLTRVQPCSMPSLLADALSLQPEPSCSCCARGAHHGAAMPTWVAVDGLTNEKPAANISLPRLMTSRPLALRCPNETGKRATCA